jgi:hypothetical protein
MQLAVLDAVTIAYVSFLQLDFSVVSPRQTAIYVTYSSRYMKFQREDFDICIRRVVWL